MKRGKERSEEESKSTFTISSRNSLSIIAGGGPFGFGGIGIYHPTDKRPLSIGLDLNANPEAFGKVFSYDDIARLKVNEEIVWINRKLPDAPNDRQDIRLTGMLEIEFFDNEELRTFLEKHVDALKFLGLNL